MTASAISEQRPLRRKIAAILAADVAGYSRLVAEAEEDTLRALAAAREILDGLVERGGGRIFNTAGDSVMCEFDSAVEAVRTAIDIQGSMAARNADVPASRRLEFRMGLTIGDVVERGGDLLGDGVNLAARLESLSPPGGLCVSRSVHEAVANKISVSFRDIGERPVKNMPQPVHAFVFEPPKVEDAPPEAALPAGEAVRIGTVPGRYRPSSPPSRTAGRRSGPLALAAAAIVAAWLGYAPARQWLADAGRPAGTTPASDPAATSPDAPGARPSQDAASVPSVPDPRSSSTAPRTGAPTTPNTSRPPTRTAEPGRLADAGKPPDIGRPADKPFVPSEQPGAFAALAREGLVADASTPAELYHNARLQEARDRPAALRSYAALLARTGDFLDADLRFANLARLAGTAATARAALTDAARATRSPAPALAAASLSDAAERRSRLEALVAANPDYAPAAYLLAEDYLAGNPTLTERRLAYDALGGFVDAAAGPSEAAFMDRSVHAGWRETARRRVAEIEATFAGAQTRPSAAFTRADAGWIASVTLPETVTSATLRIGERGEPRTTAPPETSGGKGATRVAFELPGGQARATLYVSYTDAAGHAAGPFPIAFDPTSALISAERETLERFPESWIVFQPDLPDVASYRQLVSNRCAIARASIGFGDGPPRTPLPLPPCNETNPYAIPGETRAVLSVPDSAERVEVQLTYADGTQSAVKAFSRP